MITPLFRWLVDFYAGATLLLCLAALAILFVRQPVRRHLIGWATCLGLIGLFLTSTLPGWPRYRWTVDSGQWTADGGQKTDDRKQTIGGRLVPELEDQTEPSRSVREPTTIAGREDGDAKAALVARALTGRVESSRGNLELTASIPGIFGWVFLLGTSLMTVWFLCGAWLTHRVIKQGARATGSVVNMLKEIAGQRSPRLLINQRIAQPIAAGVLRPTILLPAEMIANANSHELRAALAHEWEHIRRGDLLLLTAFRLLTLVLFAHPLFWWLKRRVCLDQEYLADHAAARTTTPIVYGECLMRWAQARSHQRLFAWAAGASGTGPRLKKRLRMLLQAPIVLQTRFSRRCLWLISSAATTAVLLVSFATLWPQPAQAQDRPVVIEVTQDGPAKNGRIQSAIDAAPPNALIRIGPGVYHERLTITKPVKLEGASWEKTRISLSNEGQPWDFAAFEEDFSKQLIAAASEEERKKLQAKTIQFTESLSHSISKADSVSLRNLSFTMPAITGQGKNGFGAILKVNGSEVSIANCAIIGGPGDGLHLDETSELAMNECLVAALWGRGIVLKGKAHIRRSDIRNCYYTGISIHHTAGPTLIEECKISGAAWHGIRYDDTSPTVRRNLIFGNARTGIYGSGKTAAKIQENLFEQNLMGGVTCWFQNVDVIERNTFVRNGGVGVSSLGASVPVVRHNLFVEDVIRTGDIGSTSPFAKVGVGPTKEGNVLWESAADAQAMGAQHFVDAAQGNFAFKANSSLRTEKVGAAELLLRQSLWPLQPEEIAIIPEGNTRDSTQWKRNKAVVAAQVATPATESDKTAVATSSAALAASAPQEPNPLQTLIDAAAPGSTVVIPKGVYTRPVIIGKPLTLRGADKAECRIEVTADQPALSFRGPGAVGIENLTIRWQLETSQHGDQPRCALYLKDAKATVSNSAVEALGNSTRCPAGIMADGFSEVQLAQLETRGFDFTIQYGGGAQGSVRDCVVRDPGHCGITVGNDGDVIIERNIVTGSGFHGVRCTGGKLIVRDNLIVQNKNRGVYLGNRRAVGEIVNNVILGNETGISGFADAAVKIHNNLIARSGFAGLDMRDTCALDIAQNIFWENKAGMILFVEKGKQSATLGKNTFWKNETNTKDLQATGEVLEKDPQFVNGAAGDFNVGATALREANQGLTQPKVLSELWRRWEKMKGK